MLNISFNTDNKKRKIENNLKKKKFSHKYDQRVTNNFRRIFCQTVRFLYPGKNHKNTHHRRKKKKTTKIGKTAIIHIGRTRIVCVYLSI